MSLIQDILWTSMNISQLAKRSNITIMFDCVLPSPITQDEIEFLNEEVKKACGDQIELDFLYTTPLLSLRFLPKSVRTE